MRMTPDQLEEARLNMDARARANKRVADLEEHVELLARLVVRMGRVNTFWWGDKPPDHPYTIPGQREYDAAMRESEGAPPTRESEGAWGHE